MNSLAIEMGYGDSDDERSLSRPQSDAPLFDSLFDFRRAGHHADALIQRAEHDVFERAILGDDLSTALDSEPDSFAKLLGDAINSRIDAALNGDGGNHLEKIRANADRVLRKAAYDDHVMCECACDQCQDGKCDQCEGEMKCENWTTVHTENEKVCNVGRTMCSPTRRLSLESAKALFAKGVRLVKYRTPRGETVELVQGAQ